MQQDESQDLPLRRRVCSVATAATTMLWASIILPITPPVLFEADDQHRVEVQLLGRDPLQAAEQRVGRSVASRSSATPSQPNSGAKNG